MRNLTHIQNAVFGEPWALYEPKFAVLCEVVERALSPENLSAAIAQPPKFEKPQIQVMDGIPIIPVSGIISRHMNMFQAISGGTSIDLLNDQFDEAMAAAPSNLCFLFDSPGGGVPGVAEFAQKIYEAAQNSSTNIIAMIDGQCCSAAYWMASQCNAVYCTPTSQTGSIGVIYAGSDSSRMQKNAGIDPVIIRSSEGKGVGVGPMTPRQTATIQTQVNYLAGMFKDAVMEARAGTGLDLTGFDPGDTFIGQQAVDAKLCDGISSLADILQKYGTKNS